MQSGLRITARDQYRCIQHGVLPARLQFIEHVLELLLRQQCLSQQRHSLLGIETAVAGCPGLTFRRNRVTQIEAHLGQPKMRLSILRV